MILSKNDETDKATSNTMTLRMLDSQGLAEYIACSDSLAVKTLTIQEFKGKAYSLAFDYNLGVIYAGTEFEANPLEIEAYDTFSYRKLGALVVKSIKDNVDALLIENDKLTEEETSQLTIGIQTGNYTYKYSTNGHDNSKLKTKKITYSKIMSKSMQTTTDAAISGMYVTMTLVNMDSNQLNPDNYESVLRHLLGDKTLPSWVNIRIYETAELEKNNLKMMLAVGRGSERSPRIIAIELNPVNKPTKTVALVGKGLTFDTGGVNIKTGGNSYGMHFDMGGSGTTFGVAQSLILQGQPLNTRYIMCAGIVENVTGSKSYHPGEVLENCVGQTTRVKNTDAEGRLVLADTVPFMIQEYGITEIITIATLTGAAIEYLTASCAPIFANDIIKRNQVTSFFDINNASTLSLIDFTTNAPSFR